MKNISISDLKKLNNVNIIDVRSIEKYNSNHIDGSMHVEFEKLLLCPEKYLDKDGIYYIYCQTGVRSLKLCRILANNGFNVVNIIGGYEAWILDE